MAKDINDMTREEIGRLYPVFLAAPDKNWKIWYQEEAQALHGALVGQNIRLSQIGSTAIEGIWAKPTIDILAELPQGADMQAAKRCIEAQGYGCMSEKPGRMSFGKGYTPQGFAERVFHLHLRYDGDHDELYFRDYMNAHPDAAGAYEQLKLALWKAYAHDREAYTNAKHDFVSEYTEKAKSSCKTVD